MAFSLCITYAGNLFSFLNDVIVIKNFVWFSYPRAENQSIGFNSGVAGGTAGGSRANWDQQQPGQFRPFGSDKPCSVLVNVIILHYTVCNLFTPIIQFCFCSNGRKQ